jgi:hypothetical protein
MNIGNICLKIVKLFLKGKDLKFIFKGFLNLKGSYTVLKSELNSNKVERVWIGKY